MYSNKICSVFYSNKVTKNVQTLYKYGKEQGLPVLDPPTERIYLNIKFS